MRPAPKWHNHLRAVAESTESHVPRRLQRRLQHVPPLEEPVPVLGAAASRGVLDHGLGEQTVSLKDMRDWGFLSSKRQGGRVAGAEGVR